MIWKINFVIDNGRRWLNKVCIVIAANEEKALEKFYKWFSTAKDDNDRLVTNKLIIKSLSLNEDDILYENYTVFNIE